MQTFIKLCTSVLINIFMALCFGFLVNFSLVPLGMPRIDLFGVVALWFAFTLVVIQGASTAFQVVNSLRLSVALTNIELLNSTRPKTESGVKRENDGTTTPTGDSNDSEVSRTNDQTRNSQENSGTTGSDSGEDDKI